MKIAYKVDEIYIANYGGICLLTVYEVAEKTVRHNYGWELTAEFHSRVIEKYGTIRRICGIPFGVRR